MIKHQWMKLSLCLEDEPDFIDLFDADETYFRLWYRLMKICVEADDEGRLTHRQGKPWLLRHISQALKCDRQQSIKFLDLCRQLGLVEILDCNDEPAEASDLGAALDSGGAVLRVADWENWWGDRRENSTERVRRWRAKHRKTDETQCNVSETLHETRGKTNSETPETPLEQEQEKSRSRKEQSRAEGESEREITGLRAQSPMLACSFDQDAFLRECDAAHRYLTGKPLPAGSRKNTLATATQLDADWKARAGAVLLTAQKIRHRIENGERIGNPWGYLLPILGDHVVAAEQYIRLAEKSGTEPEFHWSPEPVEVTV